MVGKYKLVDHTAKLDVKADYTIFVDTGYEESNMNGTWEETAEGGEFTFPAGEGVELVGTAEIKEDDVIWVDKQNYGYNDDRILEYMYLHINRIGIYKK